MKKMWIGLAIIIIICVAGGLVFSGIKKKYASYDVVLEKYINELEKECREYEDEDFNSVSDYVSMNDNEAIFRNFYMESEEIQETADKISRLMDEDPEKWINLIMDKNLTNAAQMVMVSYLVDSGQSYFADNVNHVWLSLSAEDILPLVSSEKVSLMAKVCLSQAIGYSVEKNIEDNWYDCMVDIMNELDDYNSIEYLYYACLNYSENNKSVVLRDRVFNMTKDWFENSTNYDKIVFACKIRAEIYRGEKEGKLYIDRLQEIFTELSEKEEKLELEKEIIGVLTEINTFETNKFIVEFAQLNKNKFSSYNLLLMDSIRAAIVYGYYDFVSVFLDENTVEGYNLAVSGLNLLARPGENVVDDNIFNRLDIYRKQNEEQFKGKEIFELKDFSEILEENDTSELKYMMTKRNVDLYTDSGFSEEYREGLMAVETFESNELYSVPEDGQSVLENSYKLEFNNGDILEYKFNAESSLEIKHLGVTDISNDGVPEIYILGVCYGGMEATGSYLEFENEDYFSYFVYVFEKETGTNKYKQI